MVRSTIFLLTVAVVQGGPPHLVFVLTDDNGWAGVGYQNPYLSTPTLDKLAEGGLKLTSHYTYQYCAPTRGAFLTGRLPYRLSATRANLIPWTLPDGIHLGYDMLPRALAPAGYRSVHIGKWHQGLYTPAHTPIGRGFNESYGFLEGGEDHNTSRTFGNYCKRDEVDLSTGIPNEWPACTFAPVHAALQSFFDPNSIDIPGHAPFPKRFEDETGCRSLCDNRLDCAGYSWRHENPSAEHYHQCFLVSRDGGTRNASTASVFRSALCARAGASTRPARGDNGTYTGTLFAEAAVRVVNEHAAKFADTPLFLYLALHNTHAPLEAPWEYVAPFAAAFPEDQKRAIFSGMVAFIDETVKNLTDALHANGMWDETLFIWTNDNGSPVTVGGSNHPLRGGKGSNWEGGTRVPTFVTGGVLPGAMRGKSSDGLMHIADWYQTFAGLAGLDLKSEPNAPAPRDSVDAWPWLSGKKAASARDEIVYDHRMFTKPVDDKTCHVVNTTRVGRSCVRAAVRVGDWKLVLGPEHQNGWYGWFSPNATDPVTPSTPSFASSACFPKPCLFDLGASMTEHRDVAAQHPDTVERIMRRVQELAETYHPPQDNPREDLSGYCAAVRANGNFVGPWMRVPADHI